MGARLLRVAALTRVEVVSAVVVRDGRLLLAQRHPTRSDFGLLWECPGGKVESGESPERALARELREELGVTSPRVAGPLIPVLGSELLFGPPTCERLTRVTFYHAAIGDEEPRALAAVGLGWFTRRELSGLAMTPGNVAARPYLLAALPHEPPRVALARSAAPR